MRKPTKEELTIRLNREIDHIKEYITMGVFTRNEFTEMFMRRNILAPKVALKYLCNHMSQVNNVTG